MHLNKLEAASRGPWPHPEEQLVRKQKKAGSHDRSKAASGWPHRPVSQAETLQQALQQAKDCPQSHFMHNDDSASTESHAQDRWAEDGL